MKFSELRVKDSSEDFEIRTKQIGIERTSDQDRQLTLDDLSDSQKQALRDIVDLAQKDGLCSLGGFAGSGKSTLVPFISRALEDSASTAFCAFTGKAANVLYRKLTAAHLYLTGYVGTIHRLMYQPLVNEHGRIVGWKRNDELVGEGGRPIERIIVDEASMVGSKLLDDLLSYGVPIIAVGDPGQLPPIKDRSVVEEPDVVLTEIHRQAAGNPIIQLAHRIRTEGDLPRNFSQSDNVQFVNKRSVLPVVAEGHERLGLNFGILVRRNAIRRNFNIAPRRSKEPTIGDIVICLKNAAPIYNGMRGLLDSVKPLGKHHYRASIRFPDDGLVVDAPINRYQFGREYTIETWQDVPQMRATDEMGMLFDYGIAMTVHKSQGSAFEEAVLLPEKWSSDDERDYCRWLYTAVTRCSHKITIAR